MKSRKFFVEDLANTKPRVSGETFGPGEAGREHFGRDNSPHFGGLGRLASDERGVATIEYALLCALLVIALFSGLGELGGRVSATWSDVHDEVADALDPAGASDDDRRGRGNGNGRGKGNGKGNGGGKDKP